MSSEFDINVKEFVSPFMVEHFGERDAQMDFAKIKYKPPQAAEFDLVGWIVSSINGQEEFNESSGEVKGIESLKIIGPAADLEAKGVKGYQRTAILTVDGVEYGTDPLATIFGGAMTTLGLKRQPLLAQNEMRHAGV